MSGSALFVFLTFLLQVIFLNLLIAVMNDHYTRVEERSKVQFAYAKAKIVAEFENLIPQSRRLPVDERDGELGRVGAKRQRHTSEHRLLTNIKRVLLPAGYNIKALGKYACKFSLCSSPSVCTSGPLIINTV